MAQSSGDRRGFAPGSILTLQRSDRTELLDEASLDPVELAANLRDIRRVNRLLGGTSTVIRHLPRLFARVPAHRQPISILDLATGSADIPISIARWAKSTNLSVTIVASDSSEEILSQAREQTVAFPEIALARYDALAVPLPDKQFDVVLCSLALHHFGPDDAVQVLREMGRQARTGFILNDLRRGMPGYIAAWAAAHVTTGNRLTRHDAPLSVLRAYTQIELKDLLLRAGIYDATISTHPWFRMAAVKVFGPADA